MIKKLTFEFKEEGMFTVRQDKRKPNDINMPFDDARAVARTLSKVATIIWGWID